MRSLGLREGGFLRIFLDCASASRRDTDKYDHLPHSRFPAGPAPKHKRSDSPGIGECLKYAWKASEIKSDFKDALDLIGNIFFKLEDYEKAIRFYKKTLSLDDKDSMSHYNLGCVYSATGSLIEAEKSWLSAIRYEKTKSKKPEDQKKGDELSVSLTIVGRRVAFKSHRALGYLYLKQNLKEKALQQFIKAAQLEPGSSDLYYEIGKIYSEKDDTQNAIKYFEKYLYTGGKKESEVRNHLKKLRLKHRNIMSWI